MHTLNRIDRTTTRVYTINMDSIALALKDLSLQDTPNIAATARLYNVDRSTLSRRFNKVTQSHQTKCENQSILSIQQEHTLVSYINELTERGLPPTPAMLRTFVYDIVHKYPGKDWPHRFCKRWSNCLESRYLTAMDSSRQKADIKESYEHYFSLMKQKIEQYDVQACNMYNMDEKGFLIGVLTKSKRIFTKEALSEKQLLGNKQDGNREWITVLATICADGSHLSPGLIYKALTGNLQDTWLQDFEPQQHQVFFASSPNGWTCNELGLSYLKKIFDRETKEKARKGREWRLLVVDGHGSHINMDFLDYCHKHRILVAVYPPHTTHRLQPLDVSLFSPLATYYSQELDQFIHQSQGLTELTKRDFFRLFWPAFEKAFSLQNIQSGWSKTGLYPFNPSTVIKCLSTATTQEHRPTSQGSGTSVLSASDWRHIRVLVKGAFEEVVKEGPQLTHSKEKKLTNTILHITTQNALLKAQNQGFRQALYNEKKRRKRGKHLFEDLRAIDGHGATFFSPNKIQSAKDLQEQRMLNVEAQKVARAKQNEEQRAQRAARHQAAEQRRLDRLQQKEDKTLVAKQLAKQKEVQKDSTKASRQLQDALQASTKKQRIPKDDIKASIHLQPPPPPVDVTVYQEQSIQPSGRESRTRRLPARFSNDRMYI